MTRSEPCETESPILGSAHQRAEEIYLTLRDRICLLRYPPGTKLSETLLAEEFAVSRTPIRRVLQRLEFEQLAERRQGANTTVTDFDLPSLIDIYEIRMILFENLDRLSPADRWWTCAERLNQLCVEFRRLKGVRDIEKLGRLHMALQEVLTGIIQNHRAKEILMQLYFQIARVWLSLLLRMNWNDELRYVIHEVEAIVEAVQHRDIRSVGMLRRNFISMNIQRMKAALLPPTTHD